MTRIDTTERLNDYKAFVASLTYGEEMIPMTVEDAQYALDQWKEEGTIEPPEGFTAEIYAKLWNDFCPTPKPAPCLDMTAKKDSVHRIKPLDVNKAYVLGEDHWIIHESLNAVKEMYPAKYFTILEAIDAFCTGAGIAPEDTIVRYGEV